MHIRISVLTEYTRYKKKTAYSFVTYYKTYIHAKYERSTVCCYGNTKFLYTEWAKRRLTG
jgi:hypothetical protein